MNSAHHHNMTPAEAEKRRLMIMRQATTYASAKYELGGVEKTNRRKPKPVTLPSAETLKRLVDDGD